ncbi:MAG: gliding motility-associated C-terminal domain-containing protein [Cytophagales bacterium]
MKVFLLFISFSFSFSLFAQLEGRYQAHFLPSNPGVVDIVNTPHYTIESLSALNPPLFSHDNNLPLEFTTHGAIISSAKGDWRFVSDGYLIWDSTQNIIENGKVYDSTIIKPNQNLIRKNAVEYKAFVPLEEYQQNKYYFIQLVSEYQPSEELDLNGKEINRHKVRLYYNLIEKENKMWHVTEKNKMFFEFEDMAKYSSGLSRAFLIKAVDGISTWLVVRNSLEDSYYVFKINGCGIILIHKIDISILMGEEYLKTTKIDSTNNVHFKLYPHSLLTEVRNFDNNLNFSIFFRFNQVDGKITFDKMFDNSIVYNQVHFNLLGSGEKFRPFINKHDVVFYFPYLSRHKSPLDTLVIFLSDTKKVINNSKNKVDKSLKINLSKVANYWSYEMSNRENTMTIANALNGQTFCVNWINSVDYGRFKIINANKKIDSINTIKFKVFKGIVNDLRYIEINLSMFSQYLGQEQQNQTYYAEGWVTPNLKKWPSVSLAGKCSGLSGTFLVKDTLVADSVKIWLNNTYMGVFHGLGQKIYPIVLETAQLQEGQQSLRLIKFINCATISLDTTLLIGTLAQGPIVPTLPNSLKLLSCNPSQTFDMPTINQLSNQQYNWIFKGDTLLNAQIREPGEYVLQVSNSCGVHIHKLEVSIDTFFIPNVITPNEDGLNDKLIIKPSDLQGRLSVFNRWGVLVFRKEEYENDWMAETVDSGHYFLEYIIPGSCKAKGWLQVIK